MNFFATRLRGLTIHETRIAAYDIVTSFTCSKYSASASLVVEQDFTEDTSLFFWSLTSVSLGQELLTS